MSPNDIEVLIHYHCRSDDHPRRGAPAVIEAINRFVANDILKADGDRFTTTNRGHALMELLCKTRFPEPAWMDSNGDIIDMPFR